MNWGPLHTVAALAVLSLLGLIALAHYDGATYRSGLPEAYRYLPPHSLAHSYSPNFGRSWSTIASHEGLPILALQVPGIGDDFKDIPFLQLRERCMTDEVVRSYGINPDGEFLFGVHFDRIHWVGNVVGWLAVLPVLDRDTFLHHLQYFAPHWHTPGVKIEVTGAREDAKPVEFRIRRSDSAGEGTLCDDNSGAVIRSQLKRLDGEDVGLRLLPGKAIGQLFIECRAFYAAGAEGKCLCSASDTPQSCDKAIHYEIDDLSTEPDFANPIWVVGGRYPVAELGNAFIAFPNEKTAVIVSHLELMYLSLAHQERNALDNFNNAENRQLDRLGSGQAVSRPQILAGVLRLPNLLGGGASVFSFRGDEFNIEGGIHLTLDDLKLAVLDKLFAAPRATADPLADFGPGKVEFQLADENADHYLRFLRTYWPGREKLDEMVGGFAPLLKLLTEAGFTHLQGHVLEIRRGVPTWLLGVRIDDGDRALRAVRNLQETLRKTRDIDVLTAALQGVHRENDNGIQHMKSVAELSERLAAELPSTWDQYILADGKVVFRKDGKLPDVLFSGRQQKLNDGIYTYYHVSPRITENDLKYRMDLEVLSDEEQHRIVSDDSRMVAYHDDEESILWLATDWETLKSVLGKAIGVARRPVAEAEAVRAAPSQNKPAKVIMRVQPTWLNAQLFRYPDDIQAFVKKYVEALDGYHHVEIRVSPGESSDDLLATIDLAR